MKKDKKTQSRTIRVTQRTAEALIILAGIGGLKSSGRVVDKMVREKMLYLQRKGAIK